MRKWHVRRSGAGWVAWEDGRDPKKGQSEPSWRSAWAFALLHADPAAEVCR